MTLNEQLERAAENGNVNELKDYLPLLPPIEREASHSSLLLLAASKGHNEILKILLAHNANVNVQNEVGYTPLHWAALDGYEAIARSLLDHGAMLDIKENDYYGMTPLHLASERGNEAIVKILLKNRAAIDVQDNSAKTPLHWAAYENNVEIVKILLAHNANVDAQDEKKETPLHLASSRGYIRVVKLLIETGKASLAIKNEQGKTPLELLLEKLSSTLNKEGAARLTVIRDCLVALFDYLQHLKVYREAGVKQQQLVDYLMQLEKYVQSFNSNPYGIQRIDWGPLQQARKAFYDSIREYYGCLTASDKVVAYFLDRQQALLTRRNYWLIVLKLLDPTEKCSSLLKLPFEINLMIIKMVIQSRETFHSVSFSSEEQTDYKVLVQSFFDKEPLSIEEEPNPEMSTETATVTFKA